MIAFCLKIYNFLLDSVGFNVCISWSLLWSETNLFYFVFSTFTIPASQFAGKNFAACDVKEGRRRAHVVIFVVARIVICRQNKTQKLVFFGFKTIIFVNYLGSD
jgi:hypothetical protein